MPSRSFLRKLLLLLCVGSLALVPAANAVDENLAPTPDFESNPSSRWLHHGPCTFSWASDEAHSGSRALKISSDTRTLCRWLSNVPAIPVTPGQSYDVTAWMRTAGSRAAGVLAVTFWNEAREFVSRTVYGAEALRGSREWTQLFLAATAPPDAAFLRVEIRLNGPGTLWADDVHVSEGAPYPRSGAVVKGALLEAGQTLTTTRGRWTGSPIQFEVQWIACARPEVDCVEISGATSETYTLTDAEIGMFIQSRVRATSFGRTTEILSSPRGPILQARPTSGNLARNVDLELDPAAYYSTHGPCQFDWTTSTARSPTHALRIVSGTTALCRWITKTTLIPVRPGQRYTVGAWLRTADVAGYAQLSINFWTRAPRNYIPPTVHSRTVRGTQDWTRLEVKATAPPEAAYVRVEFRVVGPGTLWADDLFVTRTTSDGETTTSSSTSSSTSSTSTSSTSSTSVLTSTTTSTTFPGGACCNGDRFIGFSRASGSGDCGDVITTLGAHFLDVECGSLYAGGGGSALSQIPSIPDGGSFATEITACTGSVASMGAATSPHTGSNRTCTAAGCFFGAPIAIPHSGSTPTSICVVTSLSAAASGEVDCSTGAAEISLPLDAIIYLTGDTSTDPGASIAGIQPCPLCSGGSCIAGPNHGKACTPETTALNASYPTSHDCPPDPMFNIGTLPLAFALTTGSVTWTATPATNDTPGTASFQTRVFAGFCRDTDQTGAFQGASLSPGGNQVGPAQQCWENDVAVGPVCVQPFESCEQRNNGAFGPTGGANKTISVIGSAAGMLAGPAPATLVGIFSIPPSFDSTVDAAYDLPGPGAIAIPGTAQSCAEANPCP